MAVKVRHPGVGQAIQRDFALMMRVARLLSLLPATAHLRLEDSLAQFAAPLREQARPALEELVKWQGTIQFHWQSTGGRNLLPGMCVMLQFPMRLVSLLRAMCHPHLGYSPA